MFERPPTDAERFFTLLVRRDPAFSFNWHYHREYELTLITRSEGRRFVGDHIGDYRPGDLVLLGPSLPHTWASHPSAKRGSHEAVVIQFSGDLLVGLHGGGTHLGPVGAMLERSALGLHFQGRVQTEVAARMRAMIALSPLRQMAELLIVLDLLARSRQGRPLATRILRPQIVTQASHPIDKVCQYINENFRQPIPLRRAARVLGMSESAFSRYFRRTTGKTFTDYVSELRIGLACQLLLETDRTIADLAGAAGFPNLSHFNRRFLKNRGLRPGEFRREHRRQTDG